jgi:uncharacterized repeat protein (TIGR02543 family)
MGGFFMYIKKSLLVFIILFLSIFTIQIQAEEPTEEPVEEPEVTILAVKQDGFTAADMLNFRTVGSTRRSGNGISIVQNFEGQAGSFFTANRIFMDESENAGFSTYFEMSTSGGNGLGFADGFTFIVSQFTNVLGNTGGSIGYGGIRNSVAILFDSWDNGGQPPLCISLGLEGFQLACSRSVASNGGTYYVWIDYSKISRTIEVRLRRNPGERPLTPVVSYTNIDLTNNIGNEFYTGFTSATGGATQNTYLSRWYFLASFSPNGIDPNGTYGVEVVKPLKPSIEINYYDENKRGWFFTPLQNENDTFAEVSFLYAFNNTTTQSYNPAVFVPDGTKELLVRTRSPGGIVSDPSDILRFNRGLFYMNYPNAINDTRWFPTLGTYELYEPIRKGYDFLGWTKRIAFNENEIIESSQFSNDQVFIGHWELRQFDMNFNTNSDVIIPSINTNIIDGFNLPSDPEKPFHTFLGWYTDETFTKPFDIETFVYDDVTLHAKWQIATYSVSVYYSETPDEKSFEHGTILNKPSEPVLENFFFDGFFTSNAYQTPYVFNQPVVKDEKVYVKWVDSIPVFAFITGVDELPFNLTLASEYKEIIKNLRDQYQNLSTDQLRFLDQSYESKLKLYEAWMVDLIAADLVSGAINDLPWIPEIEDKQAIDDVLAAYDALTENQKSYITEREIHKLLDVAKQNDRLLNSKALDVELDAIPGKLTYDDLEKMDELIAKYNALPELEQALISPMNQSKINLALQLKNESIAVISFVDKVNALETISEEKLSELLMDYDALTKSQKEAVPQIIKNRLMIVSKFHQDNAEARSFETQISNISPNDNEALEDAIKSFKALSKDQVNLLSQTTKNVLLNAGLSLDDPTRLTSFVDKVNALLTIDESMLKELLDEYDALSINQKAEVPDIITNRLMLVSKYYQDIVETKKLETLISRLKRNDQESLDNVLELYNTLSEDQINLLSEDSRKALNDAIERLNRGDGLFAGDNGSYFPWLAVVVTLTFISGSYFFYKLKQIGL